MVTVVDAYHFLKDYGSRDQLSVRGESMGEDDERTVVDLLIEQVEFCDVIVLNKTDLVTAEEIRRLHGILNSLNPRARIAHSSFGQVPLHTIMNTGLFNFEAAQEAPGWLKELRGEHVPETEEYGIRSFVYRAQRPFHPQRLWDWMNSEWPGVVRSKGHFWIASRPAYCVSWSQAGVVSRHELAGYWWAATPKSNWPQDSESLAQINRRFSGEFGDRQQEIVLIGINMDKTALTTSFDQCLLTEREMDLGMPAWQTFPDPFPAWGAERENLPEEEATW